MTPFDLVRGGGLADLVCHDEQMTVWESELLDDLIDFIRPPLDQAELRALRRAANCAIRRLVVAAFSHPELLGLPTKGTRP